jgi:hypothetical protein
LDDENIDSKKQKQTIQKRLKRLKSQVLSAESSPNQIVLKGSNPIKHGLKYFVLTYSQLALDAAVAVGLSELRPEALKPRELEEGVAGLEGPTDNLALLAVEYQA